jgi:hypothetical protein
MGSKEWSAEPKATFTRNSLPAEPRLVVRENRRI